MLLCSVRLRAPNGAHTRAPLDRHRQAARMNGSRSPEEILERVGEPIGRSLRGGRVCETLDHNETIDLAPFERIQESRVILE